MSAKYHGAILQRWPVLREAAVAEVVAGAARHFAAEVGIPELADEPAVIDLVCRANWPNGSPAPPVVQLQQERAIRALGVRVPGDGVSGRRRVLPFP